MDQYVVVTGSFLWGFTFNGPFPSVKSAIDWADSMLDSDRNPWTVAKLDKPDGRNADGEDWAGDSGQIVLIVGDAHNGHSIVGMFDSPESAFEYEENYDADSDGYHAMWVKISPPE
jgi:hypothetical protein